MVNIVKNILECEYCMYNYLEYIVFYSDMGKIESEVFPGKTYNICILYIYNPMKKKNSHVPWIIVEI